MDTYLKTSLWQQFGAAIDYLDATIRACPDELWQATLWPTPNRGPEFGQFWYIAYHTMFWLHVYLTGTEPPTPFTMIEQEDDGPLPERVYTKDELLGFLRDRRTTCKATIEALTDEMAQMQLDVGWGALSFLELQLYNFRHVHGHACQLDMLLGQNGISTEDYSTRVGT
jgi:hypothetical protein